MAAAGQMGKFLAIAKGAGEGQDCIKGLPEDL